MTVDYPDIAPILAAKQARRQALAALSWEEKVAIIDHMRHLLPREGWRVTTGLPQPNPSTGNAAIPGGCALAARDGGVPGFRS